MKFFKFNIDEEVLVRTRYYANKNSLGMVFDRFRTTTGFRVYIVKIGKFYYKLWESELEKTKLKTYSKVTIQEINFKNLRDGLHCIPVKRWKKFLKQSPLEAVSKK